MRAEFINPFISSLSNAFLTMFNCEVQRGALRIKETSNPTHAVSGIIGLSGRAMGMVVLNLSEQVALKATSAMLMVEVDCINSEVIDAVGELANMVAGGAKAQLEEYETLLPFFSLGGKPFFTFTALRHSPLSVSSSVTKPCQWARCSSATPGQVARVAQACSMCSGWAASWLLA